jgi:putative ABC transport system permease protein
MTAKFTSPADQANPASPPRRARVTLIVGSLAGFMIGLDATVVATALPTIHATLHASASMLGWTVSAYSLAFAALIITGTALGDRFGRLLGLGAVALLVGGVGIANVMVISVLERRSEIGLRRALGATRRHVAEQFLAEALLLSALGGQAGLAGALIGVAATAVYALTQHWQVLIPPVALYGGIAAVLAIGAIAGLYPATRAARLSPTEALRTA